MMWIRSWNFNNTNKLNLTTTSLRGTKQPHMHGELVKWGCLVPRNDARRMNRDTYE